MKKIITKNFGVFNAQSLKNSIASNYANVYVMLGRSLSWANADANIVDPYDNVDYRNDTLKKGIILKRVSSSDIQSVVPRVDWVSGTVYTQYDQTANLYLKITNTALVGGNVNVTSGLANTVTTTNVAQLNLAFSTPAVSPGDLIKIGEETKEVVSINVKGDYLQVNSNFSSAYTANILYKSVFSQTYANKFYVRNNLDQVFKCLYNNGGAGSTVKPEITVGGQLPENPYVETSDGYKWKYLYTITSGLKSKFFTDKYMPVVSEPVVVQNAENGRIDIIEILSAGNGYFAGTSTNNYDIIDVEGDGEGATVTADITNGKITEINIIDGGTNYSYANFKILDPLKLPATANGSIRAVISPAGGHGSNPIYELGASDLMVTVNFQSDLSDLYPTNSDATTDFRQIGIIQNPKLTNGNTAFQSVYPMYTKLFVSAPSAPYPIDSTIFVDPTGNFANASFYASVVHFDSTDNVAYINNIFGNPDEIDGKQIYEKDNTGNYSQVFAVTKPDINILSGELLYLENRSKITRHPNQTETIKLVVEF